VRLLNNKVCRAYTEDICVLCLHNFLFIIILFHTKYFMPMYECSVVLKFCYIYNISGCFVSL